MAEGLNKAILIGNLGTDPELRYTQNGQAVMRLRLATSESYADRNGVRQERTEWHTVIVWGKRAEGLNRYLSKGSRLCAEGRIAGRKWQDKNGADRYSTEIVATNIVLLGGGPKGQGGTRDDYGGGYGAGAPRKAQDPGAPSYGGTDDGGPGWDNTGGDFGDDDIPF